MQSSAFAMMEQSIDQPNRRRKKKYRARYRTGGALRAQKKRIED